MASADQLATPHPDRPNPRNTRLSHRLALHLPSWIRAFSREITLARPSGRSSPSSIGATRPNPMDRNVEERYRQGSPSPTCGSRGVQRQGAARGAAELGFS